MCLWSVNISQTNTNGFSHFYFLIARFSSNFNQSYLNPITIKRTLLALTYDLVSVCVCIFIVVWPDCLSLSRWRRDHCRSLDCVYGKPNDDWWRARPNCVCVLRWINKLFETDRNGKKWKKKLFDGVTNCVTSTFWCATKPTHMLFDLIHNMYAQFIWVNVVCSGWIEERNRNFKCCNTLPYGTRVHALARTDVHDEPN